MPLTDAGCKNAKPEAAPKKMSDGGGLYLYVPINGSKLWRMNYRFEGKQKTLSFGAYPTVGLKDAREKRDAAKRALAAGRDPALPDAIEGATFEQIAREWHSNNAASWVPAHAARVLSRLQADVFPEIGAAAVASITPAQVLDTLRKVEARGVRDTTRRLRQSISAIFRFAVATGRAPRDPAADIRDALKTKPKTRHMAALKPDEVGAFFLKLRDYVGEPVTTAAMEFCMKTMARTNEVRFARWDEIDGDVWRIPGERMKMQKDHMVPLTASVIAILKTLDHSSPWLFPGPMGKPISENTMIYACYRMGFRSRVTMHGMRSLASTVLNESGLWTPDAIERQLAHSPKNEVRAAYNAALYWPERCRMMQWWSDWLDERKDMALLLG